jgi:hypothetical protein
MKNRAAESATKTGVVAEIIVSVRCVELTIYASTGVELGNSGRESAPIQVLPQHPRRAHDPLVLIAEG